MRTGAEDAGARRMPTIAADMDVPVMGPVPPDTVTVVAGSAAPEATPAYCVSDCPTLVTDARDVMLSVTSVPAGAATET